MKEISLHIIDILENSVRAKASQISLCVNISDKNDSLTFQVSDNGKGMSEEVLSQVLDPFYTTRTTRRVGLGIPMLIQNAEMCNGSVRLQSKINSGTTTKAEFQLSHLDRPPMGDLYDGLVNLLISFPDINWVIEYMSDTESFMFNINEALGEDRTEILQLPEMVLGIKELFIENIEIINNTVTNLKTL